MNKYQVVTDNGKPNIQVVDSLEEVEKVLREFYQENKDSDYPYDCIVYQCYGFGIESTREDITDSQIIQEMIGNILEG